MNLPILTIITFLPLIGVFFILFNKGEEERVGKISFHVSLLTSLLVFVLSLFLWFSFDKTISSFQFVEEKKWIIDFVKYKVGVDGISILFVVLTAFITPICIVATIQIGVIKAVSTTKRILIPSTPTLYFTKSMIHFFSSTN